MIKKYVYHYCSVNTFYAIISNRTIRLSDVSKSNDLLEILWIVSFNREQTAFLWSTCEKQVLVLFFDAVSLKDFLIWQPLLWYTVIRVGVGRGDGNNQQIGQKGIIKRES